MGEPPSLAVKLTDALPFPSIALTLVGAPGTVDGMAPTDAEDEIPVPIKLVAATVNVYEVPFTRPVTVIGELDAVPVKPPGVDVAMYEVMDEPPFETGAVKLTDAFPFPAVALPIVGGSGTLAGVIGLLAAEDGEVRFSMFVAVTVKV